MKSLKKSLNKNNRKTDAIINLKEATAIGEKLFKPILIAKKAEPQIADKMISKKKLLTGYFVFKKIKFYF